jgi:hypothetical protein
LGLTIDQWDALDDYQRAHALAPAFVDAEQEALRCTQCGGPAADCQDTDNQHAYVVEFRRCYRTQAVKEAQEKRARASKGDMNGVVTIVTFDPTRKKSARKVATSG